MVHYRLIYFNSRGRAEPLRFLFALAGVEYEDVRLDHGENWQAMKPKTPFGQVPVLEIDGVQVAQTKAIARYLGKEFNMAGRNNLESAKADMLVEGAEDVGAHMRPVFREKDPEKKKELFEVVKNDHITPFLKRYEHFLEESGTGYFVNDQITWADVFLFDTLQKWEKRHSELLQNYPKLRQFVEKVASNPRIKAWIEKRPETEN
jgi:glutathione S-transferase